MPIPRQTGQIDRWSLVQNKVDMARQCPMVDLVGAVVQRLEYLGIQQANEEIEGRVIIRDHGIEGAFFLSQSIQVHVIMVGDSLDLRQVEGSQPHSGADQDAFCRLAGGLLEYLILPQGHTFRMLMLHRLKQQVQRRDVFVIILPDFSVFQHAHDHGKVLFICRRFLVQHEDNGLEQSCF